MHRITITAAGFVALLMLPAALLRAEEQDKDLQGEWELKSLTENGEERAAGAGRGAVTVAVQGDPFTVREGGAVHKSAYKADASKTPRQMDVTPQDGDDKGKSVLAIYEISGDELRVCHADPGKDRPTELAAKKGSGWTLAVFKRIKK